MPLRRPLLPHRAHGPLAAAIVLVALTTLGCTASDPESSGILSGRRSSDAAHAAPSPEDRPEAPPADLPAPSGHSDPFDTSQPSIARLDPDLLDALRAAARDAQDDGIDLTVTSGWRSREHQQRLYDETVQKYGSEEEARRYVATPDGSAHVTGDAVDIGPTDALGWLSQHGDDYGLCQIFSNEVWHYELATDRGGECPRMLPDGRARG
jgi:D-alanyl-D-alanine carboxypeptidase